MNLQSRIEFQNTHWGGTTYPTPPFTRQLASSIWQDISLPLICLVTGSRRTGKSIILKQTLNRLIAESHIPPRQILFYEFSPYEPTKSIWEIYEYFCQNITDTHLPTYLFFDEVQYLSDYEAIIKLIYDQRPNTKIFLTGSLSLSYKQKMSERLAGRFFTYHLPPLNFLEYLELYLPSLTDLFQSLLTETDSFKRTKIISLLNPHFPHFLECGRYPEPLYQKLDKTQTKAYFQNIISQSLNQDAFNYFEIHKPQIIQSLFLYLQQNSGSEISLTKLSNLLDTSLPTLSHYLDILEIMDLIYPLYNSINPLFKHNRSRKIYVNSSFQLAIPTTNLSTALGYATESYVYERLLFKYPQITYYRQRNKEIDFVIPDQKLGFEVKYRELQPTWNNPNPKINTLLLTTHSNPSILTI